MGEMHIKEDLVYDKHSGELVGFVNLGETNNHLIQFEQQVEGNASEYEPLANSMVVMMVRGLLRTFSFPMHSFPVLPLQGTSYLIPFGRLCRGLRSAG